MKKIERFKYVYENWYVKSCNKANETPVTFDQYYNTVSEFQIKDIENLLDKGITP